MLHPVPIANSFLHRSLWPITLLLVLTPSLKAIALPPPEDIPEEVLRNEIILEARSPVDGKPISPADYAELQAQLQEHPHPELSLSSDVRHIIFLLQLRQALKLLTPF